MELLATSCFLKEKLNKYRELFERDFLPQLELKDFDNGIMNLENKDLFSPFLESLYNAKDYYSGNYIYYPEKEKDSRLPEKIQEILTMYSQILEKNKLEGFNFDFNPNRFQSIYIPYYILFKWYETVTILFLHLQENIDELQLIDDLKDDKQILDVAEMTADDRIREFLVSYVEIRFFIEGYYLNLCKLGNVYEERIKVIYDFLSFGGINDTLFENSYKILELFEPYIKHLKLKKLLPVDWQYNFKNLPLTERVCKKLFPQDIFAFYKILRYFDKESFDAYEIENKGGDEENVEIEENEITIENVQINSFKNNKKVRVFISSTFSDMQAERDELVKTFNMLKQEAERKGITVTMVDLRWGITSEESARGDVIDICLKEIEKSKPFFVGILGDNYGSAPSPELSENNELLAHYPWLAEDIKKGLSFTEIEMQSAVLRNPETLNAYFFIKESDKTETSIKLKNLKSAIRNQTRYPVYDYSSPEEISGIVTNQFRKILNELCSEVDISLMDKLVKQQELRLAHLRNFFIKSKGIDKKIKKFFEDDSKRILFIEGEKGIGKSALCADIIEEYFNSYDTYYYFVGENGINLFELIYYLQKTPVQKENVYNNIVERIKTIDRKTLIVIDSADKVRLNGLEHLISLWLSKLPQLIKIVVSAQNESGIKEILTSHPEVEILKINPFFDKQQRKFIESFLGSKGKKLNEKQMKHLENSNLLKNPALLRSILEELSAFGHYEKLDERIAGYSQIQNISNLYMQIFKKLENDYGKDKIGALSKFIFVSTQGLTESDLISIYHLRQLDLSLILGNGEAIYRVEEGIIKFANQQIKEIVYELYIGELLVEMEIREKYVDWLKRQTEDFSLTFNDYNYLSGNFSYHEKMRYVIELAYQVNSLGDLSQLSSFFKNLYYYEVIFRIDRTLLNDIWEKLEREGFDFENIVNEIKEGSYDPYLTPVILNDLIRLAKDNYKGYLGIELSEAAIKKLEKLGESNYVKMTIYGIINNAAIAAAQNKMFDKAIELFERSKELVITLFPEISEERAKTYKNFGQLYVEMDQPERAFSYFQEALRIYESIYHTEFNLKSADVRSSLIDVLYYMEKDDESIEMAQKTAEIFFKLQGEASKEGYLAKIKIGRTLKDSRRTNEAIELLNIISEESLQKFGRDSWVTHFAFRLLGMCWEKVINLMQDMVTQERYKEYVEYAAYAFSYSDRPEKAKKFADLLSNL